MRSRLILTLFLGCVGASGQTTESALRSAETGHCDIALPFLRRSLTGVQAAQSKRRIGVDGVRCAMQLDRWNDASQFLGMLVRDFPNDPEVLYLATHAYSDLSMRASQKLLYTAPSSPQVHQLNAESLEAQEKWDQALAEYRRVLETSPRQPGIHYRIGRLILSKPKTDRTAADAQREMEAELAIDPENAGAHYVLGELARQSENWPVAIAQFQSATEKDSGFADAFLGLGQSYKAAGDFVKAVPALETAARLEPDNPTAHYELALAYTRVGRRADAQRENALQQKALAQAQAQKDEMKRGLQ